MTEQKIPELRIGKIDGVWTVAMADRFGWVEVGSGEPLDETLVAYDWTPLVPAPPAPRVFFPGDRVPNMSIAALKVNGVVSGVAWCGHTITDANGPAVEISLPTLEEWQATVDRARAERGEQP